MRLLNNSQLTHYLHQRNDFSAGGGIAYGVVSG